MASCQTKQWVSTAPYFKLTVTQSSSASTTVTLSYTVQYVAQYAAVTSGAGNRTVSVTIDGKSVGPFTYAINGVTGTNTVASGTVSVSKGTSARSASFSISVPMNLTWSGTHGGTMSGSSSISIPAKASYTVSYSANGGSGAPGSQTKWAGTALTLSSTKPTRTGYSFKNWLSSAQNATFSPGASYTYDASTTMKARWTANTYTVAYFDNGGTGAPGTQVKTHGVGLTLSTDIPTRTNYTFKGWGVSSSSTTASYQPGDTYTANVSIVLYAIWELAYAVPRITNMTVDRCTSSGTLSDEGTYAVVVFSWATDKAVSSIKIDYKTESATSWGSATSISASGTSGSIEKIIGGSFDAETTYNIRVTVADASGSNELIQDIAPMEFPIDFKAGGTGVAFGKPATTDNLFEVEYPAQFNNGLVVGGQFVRPKRCIVGQSGSKSDNSWYKFASMSTTRANDREQITFRVTYDHNDVVDYGTINAKFRTDSSGAHREAELVIESDTGLNPSDFVLAYTTGVYELWVNIQYSYSFAKFEVLSETYTNSFVDRWTLYDQVSVGYASSPTSGYTQITAVKGLLDTIYPVNSIYISYSHTSPASLFGGTWTRITGHFLYAVGSSATIGYTGGSATVTLTIDEIPSHQHYLLNYNSAGQSQTWSTHAPTATGTIGYTGNIRTNNTGGGNAHNNMPPYIQVSIWRRTA